MMNKAIESYIFQFPLPIQNILNTIRQLGLSTCPNSTEAIKYGIPTIIMKKNVFHFAAYKNHIGFYPGVSTIEKFSAKLLDYKTSKGAIQFPITKAIPYELIKEMIEYRLTEIK